LATAANANDCEASPPPDAAAAADADATPPHALHELHAADAADGAAAAAAADAVDPAHEDDELDAVDVPHVADADASAFASAFDTGHASWGYQVTYIHANVHTYIHTNAHTYTHTHTQTSHTHTHAHTLERSASVCQLCSSMHIHTYISGQRRFANSASHTHIIHTYIRDTDGYMHM